jgi:hypothetical protein
MVQNCKKVASHFGYSKSNNLELQGSKAGRPRISFQPSNVLVGPFSKIANSEHDTLVHSLPAMEGSKAEDDLAEKEE